MNSLNDILDLAEFDTLFNKRFSDYESFRDELSKSSHVDYTRLKLFDSLVQSSGDKLTFCSKEAALSDKNESKASALFIISKINEDRSGDIVIPQGVALEHYKNNPTVFFGHNSYKFPVGSCYHDGTKDCGISVEPDKRVLGNCVFHQKTQESADVCALVMAGELRCASIGFRPKRATVVRRKDEDESRPKNEVRWEPFVKFTFHEWDLYEWSIVGIPDNPECVALRLSKGIGGKQLSEPVRKMLEPYAPPAVAWANGFTPPPVEKKNPNQVAFEEIHATVKTLGQSVAELTNMVRGLQLQIQPPADPPKPETKPVTPEVDPNHAATVKALNDSLQSLRELRAERNELKRALSNLTGRVD